MLADVIGDRALREFLTVALVASAALVFDVALVNLLVRQGSQSRALIVVAAVTGATGVLLAAVKSGGRRRGVGVGLALGAAGALIVSFLYALGGLAA